MIEGPVLFSTKHLKLALKMECRAAKVAFGRALNTNGGKMMDVCHASLAADVIMCD